MNRNISAFLGCESEYGEAKTVIFGAPFDSTTSFRPGARFGPGFMRSESVGLESYSPYQDKDLTDSAVFDGGDLELPFGNSHRALSEIRNFVTQILHDEKLPCMIGGEHLVTLGAVQAVAEKYPDLHLLHFDAHADLRDDYLGESLSHACVIRRCWEIMGDGRIFQFGIRSGTREEFLWAKEHTQMCPYNFDKLSDAIEDMQGKPVYVTLDLDVLDPSIFPGTGTPEAGGVDFNTMLQGILSLRGLNIVGLDINELSPHYDHSGVSTAVACKALRELLLVVNQQHDQLR